MKKYKVFQTHVVVSCEVWLFLQRFEFFVIWHAIQIPQTDMGSLCCYSDVICFWAFCCTDTNTHTDTQCWIPLWYTWSLSSIRCFTLCFSEAGSHCSSWAHAGLEFILLSRSTSRVLGLWACAATSQLSVVYSDFFSFHLFLFFFFCHYRITPTSVLFVSFFWKLPLFSWVFAWTVLF